MEMRISGTPAPVGAPARVIQPSPCTESNAATVRADAGGDTVDITKRARELIESWSDPEQERDTHLGGAPHGREGDGE